MEFEPDADLHGHRALALERVAVRADPLLHAERGVARAHRVVLAGERRPEQRHEPVAHDLGDGALVAMDRLHHVLERLLEDARDLLGIALGEQLHRALHVGEQHRDLLALAGERGARVEDARGEVGGV